MTPNKEDYLKIIFELGGYDQKVPNKAIVASLNVSAASVSEMISKLEKDGFVSHSPYQGVQLTANGLNKASALIRKHRLWEVFLVNKLGYKWHEVHAEAEVLEHVTSEELANRLEVFLNFPKNCPHGGIIPQHNQSISEINTQTLNDVPVGTTLKIERVLDERELLDYLASISLEINTILTLTEIGAYEGPITLVDQANHTYQISRKAANNIFISVL
ncbi:metal-dependent transcriptional regulator [Vagococcus humatus]|uniref:Manganese transport regulator n=1 Tax=Vagococcus humatus TaxID=1889241 RepID=A0A3R9YX56_9ENTE|nr:metal-dependent transcriptional regulator [Vagococcus humatus]RST89476.1 Cro/Cl family transcriptional regulator [Vagococcus humatus]